MPFALSEATMVTSPDGCGVIIIGGNITSFSADEYFDDDDNWIDPASDKILELRSDATEWVILDQCLENPRREHVAFPITDEIETNFKEKYSLEDEK